MFDIAALGLLQQEPLHGYRLKQKLELFMSGCISVNYGTIYPLLRRLQHQGAIATTNASAIGASRRIYHITDQGREHWKALMLEHPHESWVNARSRFMIKLFFFSHLPVGERLQLLEHRLSLCRSRLLTTETQAIDQQCSDPYQRLVWQYHRATLQAEIDWLNNLVELPPHQLVNSKHLLFEDSHPYTFPPAP
jgi:DNA-binding PadR family transcriptional regulator